MRFGSVCSGIEAASVAWHPLGWQAAWLAEIEPFPSAVLAHHYPAVPNLGDMTTIARRVLTGELEAPDVLCGGTPCQAFSVAGLRESLADERGNLTLKFVELANAIDHVRIRAGKPPCIVVWENVPGVLSTKDNAFGCFLAGISGEDGALEPPGGRWSDSGCVYGPSRAVAWRTLDSQYLGLAQRRRRVFVVASAREGFDPSQVLFEWHGVRRDSAPSRETGKVAPTIPARSTGGGGLGTDFDCDGGLIQAFGGNRTSGSIEVSPALLAQPGSGWKGDFESETFLVQPTHNLRGEGFDASEDGTGRGTPLVPVVSGTLGANHGNIKAEHAWTGQLVAFDTTQITSAENRSNPKPGDPCHPLAAGAHPPAIAFDTYNQQATGDITQTLCSRGDSPGGNAHLVPAIAYDIHGVATEVTHTLDQAQGQAIAFHPTQDPINSTDVCHAIGTGNGQGCATAAVAFDYYNMTVSDKAETVKAESGTGSRNHTLTAMQVRRLTPTECERLQGFPDGYTAIPWRGKSADQCPDGPRYKSLGNSWAVPVARWVGRRIQEHLA